MKVLLCLIPLLGLDLSQASADDWLPTLPINSYLDRNNYYYGVNRFYGDYNEKEDNKYDDDNHHDYKYKPCSLKDLKCIRDFLIQKIICLQSYEPIFDPYIVKKIFVDTPSANSSAIIYDMTINGFDSGRIEELYINKTTDTLILEVVFEELPISTPKVKIIYYQKGKEPKVMVDTVEIIYRKLSLTLIVYHLNDAHRRDSHVYAFLSEPRTLLLLGPDLDNPDTGEGSSALLTEQLNSSMKEALSQGAPVLLAAYLNNRVCNLKRHLEYSSQDRY